MIASEFEVSFSVESYFKESYELLGRNFQSKVMSMSKRKITDIEILRYVNEINLMYLDLVKLIETMMDEHKQFTDEIKTGTYSQAVIDLGNLFGSLFSIMKILLINRCY